MATYDLTSNIPTKIVTGDILNCPYSGTYKTIILPKGTYKLECWGARGGKGGDGSGNADSSSVTYGCGGYSIGTINLKSQKVIYLYAGGVGGNNSGKISSGCVGGFNGGGNGGNLTYTSSGTNGSGGGGASDIRIGSDSLYARVIVAGGGGGASWASTRTSHYGGHGGGISGTNGVNGYGSTTVATGGTQTAGGSGSIQGSNARGASGTFGYGGNGSANAYGVINSGAGGGGGWYGGGAGGPTASGNQAHAGGGSGYVYTASTASNYPSGCLLDSSMYLTDANTIAGNASMPSTSGPTEIGHSGNGYVRITVIKVNSIPFRMKVNGSIVEASEGYVKVNGTWKEITGVHHKSNGEWSS